MEDANTEILLQGSGQDLYVSSVLFGKGFLIEVSIVLDVLYPGAKVGSPAGYIQFALHACTEFLVHAAIVPVIVIGMIATQVERRKHVAYVAPRIEVHRIFPQPEVQVQISFDSELSDGLIQQSYLAVDVVMQQSAFALGQFTSEEDFLLRKADATSVRKRVRIHQIVSAEFMGDIGGKSCFGVFIESLQQCYAECVLHAEGGSGVVAEVLV